MSGVLMVTGASRGIGAACARAGARGGYDVCVNYLGSEEQAAAVVKDVEALGRRAVAIRADMGVETDIVRLFEQCDSELGSVTALVNNAGIVGGQCLVEEVTGEILERVMAVNVAGPFLCAREAVRRMSTEHGGKGGGIVNISSVAARLGNAFLWVHYAATKGAIDTFTTGLSLECAEKGIRVNAIRPGIIDTEIHPEGRIVQIESVIPLKRAGTADEVADVAMYLLSERSSYVTGAIVDVGGGR